jgi:hypothetical protein
MHWCVHRYSTVLYPMHYALSNIGVSIGVCPQLISRDLSGGGEGRPITLLDETVTHNANTAGAAGVEEVAAALDQPGYTYVSSHVINDGTIALNECGTQQVGSECYASYDSTQAVTTSPARDASSGSSDGNDSGSDNDSDSDSCRDGSRDGSINIDCTSTSTTSTSTVGAVGAVKVQCPVCNKEFDKLVSLSRHLGHHTRKGEWMGGKIMGKGAFQLGGMMGGMMGGKALPRFFEGGESTPAHEKRTNSTPANSTPASSTNGSSFGSSFGSSTNGTPSSGLLQCACAGGCSLERPCACSQLNHGFMYDSVSDGDGTKSVFKSLLSHTGGIIWECTARCGCPPSCSNRAVQRGVTTPLQVFRAEGDKGWGVRPMEALRRGEFVCEYVGELILDAQAETRCAVQHV